MTHANIGESPVSRRELRLHISIDSDVKAVILYGWEARLLAECKSLKPIDIRVSTALCFRNRITSVKLHRDRLTLSAM